MYAVGTDAIRSAHRPARSHALTSQPSNQLLSTLQLEGAQLDLHAATGVARKEGCSETGLDN
jgi:hypothetical protein